MLTLVDITTTQYKDIITSKLLFPLFLFLVIVLIEGTFKVAPWEIHPKYTIQDCMNPNDSLLNTVYLITMSFTHVVSDLVMCYSSSAISLLTLNWHVTTRAALKMCLLYTGCRQSKSVITFKQMHEQLKSILQETTEGFPVITSYKVPLCPDSLKHLFSLSL